MSFTNDMLRVQELTNKGLALFDEMYAEARGWLADRAWADRSPEDFEDLPDELVRQGLERHYFGGWQGFMADHGWS